jgi:integrase/recombinase XerC
LESFLVAEANRGLQADTVARRLNSLRSFYKDALHQRLIAENPTVRIPTPRRPKRLGRYLKDSERTRLLANLPRKTRNDKRKAAIVATFCHAGLRLAELAALNVDDIGEDNLRVQGKGRVQREVPIGQRLRLVLNAWLAVHPTQEGALFTSLGDEPGRLSHCQLRSIVKQVFEDLGLGDRRYTPLTLRHTFATRLVKKGAPIQDVQRVLGHANINTTLVYIHTQFDSKLIDLMDD